MTTPLSAWTWKPSWTPDSRYVTYSSDHSGSMEIYRKPADGSGEAESVVPDANSLWAGASWSPDGRHLAYTIGATTNDLMVFDVEQGGQPEVFVSTSAVELFPTFSPDGRWIVYQSDESGTMEVYVRPFPGPGGKWQISRGGGGRAVWADDGTALYYVSKRKVINKVPITTQGDSLRAGRATVAFEAEDEIQGSWDVDRDGSFVLSLRQSEEEAPEARATALFVFNWSGELDELVP